MTNMIGSRMTDGIISEPSPASRVSAVFPNTPAIKSYVEAAMDYYVTKPSSTFTLQAPDEFIRWRTTWGAAPSSGSLKQTMGRLQHLYGFDDSVTWSPSCWNLDCPVPGQTYGSVAAPFKADPMIYHA